MKLLKLTLLFCFVTSLAFSNVSQKEKNALLAIYNTTQGENWKVIWNLETPVSTWTGVKVENDKIVELDVICRFLI